MTINTLRNQSASARHSDSANQHTRDSAKAVANARRPSAHHRSVIQRPQKMG
jgi:hypothetical protein